MPKPWILTSPASRGIGLHLAKRLLKTTDCPVVATARSNLEETKRTILEGLSVNIDRLEVLKVDVMGIRSAISVFSTC